MSNLLNNGEKQKKILFLGLRKNSISKLIPQNFYLLSCINFKGVVKQQIIAKPNRFTFVNFESEFKSFFFQLRKQTDLANTTLFLAHNSLYNRPKIIELLKTEIGLNVIITKNFNDNIINLYFSELQKYSAKIKPQMRTNKEILDGLTKLTEDMISASYFESLKKRFNDTVLANRISKD